MTRILYYLFIKPLSLLPLEVLYLLSDILYFFLYIIFGYRKKVVRENLLGSFPDYTLEKIKKTESTFYRHLCDIIVETIRLFSMSVEEAQGRFNIKNIEVSNQFFEQGRDVMVALGHYGNWEFTGPSAGKFLHEVFTPFAPLSDKFLDKKIRTSRQKGKGHLIPKDEIRKRMREPHDRPRLFMFLSDQNPSSRSGKLFWTRFLNRDTAVNFGIEKYAVQHDMPVIFARITRKGRGYFDVELELITDKPQSLPHGEITMRHTQLLEEQIKAFPGHWLWSHKRWKRKRSE